MDTKDFFSTLQRMRGLRGDTFPEFRIRTRLDSLTGCTMRLVLEDVRTPGSVTLTKICEPHTFDGGVLGFRVQLASSETAQLCGTYTMHFILTDAQEQEHRNLVGTLVVLDVPQEVS